MRVITVSDNYTGGVNSLNKNLVANRPAEIEQWVIQVDCRQFDITRAVTSYQADKVIPFPYSQRENYYSIIRRMRRSIPDEPGALVLNDFVEMWMLDHYPVQQTVYQLIHDTYYVKLAAQNHHVVDVFITHNLHLVDKLKEVLPEDRIADIYYLPHGVTIPEIWHEHKPGEEKQRLKLLFLARMVESKGIFDLIAISDLLREMGCEFEWTCIGNGPDLPQLKERWKKEIPVTFVSPDTNREVIDIATRHDVFVLPTKFDGTPVSLIETMSVGLVPVITDLPGGIHEIVSSDIGFALPMDDNMAFAKAIQTLDNDRSLLQRLGRNCREKAQKEFDVRHTAASYYAKFQAFKDLYKPKKLQKRPLGTRLDHPLIPSFVTKTLRSIIYKKA